MVGWSTAKSPSQLLREEVRGKGSGRFRDFTASVTRGGMSPGLGWWEASLPSWLCRVQMFSSYLRKETGGRGKLTCLLGYGGEVSAWNERIREMFSIGRINETGLSVGWRLTGWLVLTDRDHWTCLIASLSKSGVLWNWEPLNLVKPMGLCINNVLFLTCHNS